MLEPHRAGTAGSDRECCAAPTPQLMRGLDCDLGAPDPRQPEGLDSKTMVSECQQPTVASESV